MSLGLGEKLVALVVALSDRWLGTHLAERILARYDARIAALKQELAAIEAARDRLGTASEALVVSTCAALLAGLERSSAGGLLFEPGSEHESLLQSAIDVLVKPGLATVRDHARPGDRFAYELFPRWDELCDHLLRLSERIDSPELAAHVRQNVARIRASLPGSL
ncbi:MAG: hypothetical protein JW850_06170 [Thermoflexales bacterium]|nr:hypothetical protein [Thermoflexales bacterium]